jgi:hypothetical protein
MKITIHETLKPGTYTLTPEVTEPNPLPPRPTTKNRIPVFSPRVTNNKDIRLSKPTVTQSMGIDANVQGFPWPIVQKEGRKVFYCPNRVDQTAWCEPLGHVKNDDLRKGFILHDVIHEVTVQDNKLLWMLYENNEGIHLASSVDYLNFKTVYKVDTFGAKDSRHTFEQINSDYIIIHGRTRSGDWGESVARWADRRGVKRIKINLSDGQCTLLSTIDPIDHYEGGRSEYKKAQIRTSYYSSDVTKIGDTLLSQIGVYFQDEQRQVPDRPDRPNGTGETYPVPFISVNGKWNPLVTVSSSLLDLSMHTRPSANGMIEVGQIHAGSMMWDEGDLICPYMVRNDTHYEFGSIPFKPTEHFLARWKQGRFAYLTNCTVTVDGIVAGLDYVGNEPTVLGNKIIIDRTTKLYYIDLEAT